MVPVLIVTGPIGVGKTAILLEADAQLVDARATHATLELEDVARCWTEGMEQDRVAVVHRNLAAIWSSFAAVGATRLLLSALVEQRSDLQRISDAVPGAEVTLVRLHAPVEILEQRIRLREPEPARTEGELDGARWWAGHLNDVRPEDHLVETAERSVGEVAGEVLRVAGWLV